MNGPAENPRSSCPVRPKSSSPVRPKSSSLLSSTSEGIQKTEKNPKNKKEEHFGFCSGSEEEKLETFSGYWREGNIFCAEKMNSSSPAHSSLSTTAVVGGGGGGGGGSNAAVSVDDFHFPCDPISTQVRKDEAMLVLKSDLMAALDKEVKSLDEDNWKFEGPRSRIHLVSRRGGYLHKPTEISKNWNLNPSK